ncbi:MAG: hypothetical protein ACLU98_05815 [Desulfovibrio fairfieldensis]
MGQLTKQFGKIKISLPIPHLLNLQIDSYQKFLQEGVPEADRRPDEGLEGVFHTVFPIEDFNKTASLEFVSYEVQEPKYDQAECISKGLTYEAPMRIKVRLVVYDADEASGNRTIRDIKEQDIYFAPCLMTEKGTSSSTAPSALSSTSCSALARHHLRARRRQDSTPAARCSIPAG